MAGLDAREPEGLHPVAVVLALEHPGDLVVRLRLAHGAPEGRLTLPPRVVLRVELAIRRRLEAELLRHLLVRVLEVTRSWPRALRVRRGDLVVLVAVLAPDVAPRRIGVGLGRRLQER